MDTISIDMPGENFLRQRRGPTLLAQMERERGVLSRIANGDALSKVLDDLLTSVEAGAATGLKTSILELSEDGQNLTHLAGPSIPPTFKEAIDGVQIGEGVGSCGTVVHRGTPVYVSDIENDPLWTSYRDIAISHELRACWSTPIIGMKGDILGTFAMYYQARRSPSAQDIESIAAIALTVALAIERSRSDTEIRRLNSSERSLLGSRVAQTGGGSFAAPLDRARALLRDPLVAGANHKRALTQIGRVVVKLARERIQEIEGRRDVLLEKPLKLGVGSVFIDRFTRKLNGLETAKLSLSSGICFEVADAFANNEIDLAYVLEVKNNRVKLQSHIVAEHRHEMAWVCALQSTVDPKRPVPLAVYPGDRVCIEALRSAGRPYELAFSSKEYASKLSAVKSGKYITAIPRSMIEFPFEEILDADLPPLPVATALIAARDGFDDRVAPILSILDTLRN